MGAGRVTDLTGAATQGTTEDVADAPTLSPQRQGTLTAKAYTEILERITTFEFQPGRSFSETELADELGLSKTPVREALLILGAQGFVFPRPRSGYRVSPITMKDVRDFFGFWRLVEGECAALVARKGLDQKLLLHMEDLAAQIDPRDEAGLDDFIEMEVDLHRHLARESGNDRLAAHGALLMHDLARLLRLTTQLTGSTAALTHDHDSLVEAVATRDAEAARAVAVAEIDAWERVVLDALLDSAAVQNMNLGGRVGSTPE